MHPVIQQKKVASDSPSHSAGKRRSRWFFAWTLLVVVAGCRGGSPAEKRQRARIQTTKPNPKDADWAFRDDQYRIGMKLPGPDWMAMDRGVASRYAPNAIGGVRWKDRYFVVVAERTDGATLDQWLDTAVQRMRQAGRILQQGRSRFRDRDAAWLFVELQADGIPFRLWVLGFVRDGYTFQLLGSGLPTSLEHPDALAPCRDAVVLLPGKVAGRAAAPRVVEHGRGVGWHVRRDAWEHGYWRLRLKKPDGWQLDVSRIPVGPDQDDSVLLEHPERSLAVRITGHPVSSTDHATLTEHLLRDHASGVSAPTPAQTLSVAVLGAPVSFRWYPPKATGDATGEHDLFGVRCLERLCLGVRMAAARSAAADVPKQLREVMAGLERLPEEMALALVKRLAAQEDPQHVVAGPRVLRGGSYLDFAHGIVLPKPGPGWHLQIPPESTGGIPADDLHAREVETGSELTLRTDPCSAGQIAEHHREQVTTMRRELGSDHVTPARSIRVAGGSALRSAARGRRGGRWVDVDVLTIDRGTHVVTLQVSRGALGRGGDLAEEVLRRLAFHEPGTFPEESSDDQRYRNHRFGFSVRLRQGMEVAPSDLPEPLRASGLAKGWTGKDSAMMVLALPGDRDRTLAEIAREVAGEILTRFYNRMLKAEPTESPSRVAGRSALRLTWTPPGERMDAWVMKRTERIYVLVSMDRDPSGKMAEEVRQGFELLP